VGLVRFPKLAILLAFKQIRELIYYKKNVLICHFLLTKNTHLCYDALALNSFLGLTMTIFGPFWCNEASAFIRFEFKDRNTIQAQIAPINPDDSNASLAWQDAANNGSWLVNYDLREGTTSGQPINLTFHLENNKLVQKSGDSIKEIYLQRDKIAVCPYRKNHFNGLIFAQEKPLVAFDKLPLFPGQEQRIVIQPPPPAAPPASPSPNEVPVVQPVVNQIGPLWCDNRKCFLRFLLSDDQGTPKILTQTASPTNPNTWQEDNSTDFWLINYNLEHENPIELLQGFKLHDNQLFFTDFKLANPKVLEIEPRRLRYLPSNRDNLFAEHTPDQSKLAPVRLNAWLKEEPQVSPSPDTPPAPITPQTPTPKPTGVTVGIFWQQNTSCWLRFVFMNDGSIQAETSKQDPVSFYCHWEKTDSNQDFWRISYDLNENMAYKKVDKGFKLVKENDCFILYTTDFEDTTSRVQRYTDKGFKVCHNMDNPFSTVPPKSGAEIRPLDQLPIPPDFIANEAAWLALQAPKPGLAPTQTPPSTEVRCIGPFWNNCSANSCWLRFELKNDGTLLPQTAHTDPQTDKTLWKSYALNETNNAWRISYDLSSEEPSSTFDKRLVLKDNVLYVTGSTETAIQKYSKEGTIVYHNKNAFNPFSNFPIIDSTDIAFQNLPLTPEQQRQQEQEKAALWETWKAKGNLLLRDRDFDNLTYFPQEYCEQYCILLNNEALSNPDVSPSIEHMASCEHYYQYLNNVINDSKFEARWLIDNFAARTQLEIDDDGVQLDLVDGNQQNLTGAKRRFIMALFTLERDELLQAFKKIGPPKISLSVTPDQVTPGAVTPPRLTPGAANPAQPRPGTVTPPRPTPGTANPPQPAPGTANPPRPTPGAANPPRPTPGAANPAEPTPGTANPPQPTPGTANPPRPTPGAANPPRPTPEPANPPATPGTDTNQPSTDDFLNKLLIIKTKAQDLRDRNFDSDANCADALYTNIKIFYAGYQAKLITAEAFRDKALAHVENVREKLETHRGWKQVIGNIILAVLGVGVIYFVAACVNLVVNNRFLFFNTDTGNKLEELGKDIERVVAPVM